MQCWRRSQNTQQKTSPGFNNNVTHTTFAIQIYVSAYTVSKRTAPTSSASLCTSRSKKSQEGVHPSPSKQYSRITGGGNLRAFINLLCQSATHYIDEIHFTDLFTSRWKKSPKSRKCSNKTTLLELSSRVV
ncbi:hypothetical protein BaRGS_00024870 [Batillaria attramentaria]|uniref:Uncharacterized protein n=1 Tax=Batillaria attramentaria TaxID=370345 RepID=A0ABD0K9S9_9CAEN